RTMALIRSSRSCGWGTMGSSGARTVICLPPVSFEPITIDEILICPADGVRMNLVSNRHLANAWQHVSWPQLSSRNQEDDLFSQLAVDGYVATFIDLNIHFVREILFPFVTLQKLYGSRNFWE